MRIVSTLCPAPLKTLSLIGNAITRRGCARIVDALKRNKHSFTTLELFQSSQHSSAWQNEIRRDIDRLTWENQLQVEKDTWIDLFLDQNDHTQQMFFLALERAKRADDERFSDAPNMVFYLVKQMCSPFLTDNKILIGMRCYSSNQLFTALLAYHCIAGTEQAKYMN